MERERLRKEADDRKRAQEAEERRLWGCRCRCYRHVIIARASCLQESRVGGKEEEEGGREEEGRGGTEEEERAGRGRQEACRTVWGGEVCSEVWDRPHSLSFSSVNKVCLSLMTCRLAAEAQERRDFELAKRLAYVSTYCKLQLVMSSWSLMEITCDYSGWNQTLIIYILILLSFANSLVQYTVN